MSHDQSHDQLCTTQGISYDHLYATHDMSHDHHVGSHDSYDKSYSTYHDQSPDQSHDMFAKSHDNVRLESSFHETLSLSSSVDNYWPLTDHELRDLSSSLLHSCNTVEDTDTTSEHVVTVISQGTCVHTAQY